METVAAQPSFSQVYMENTARKGQKLKIYQLGISKVYFKGHPKAGNPTHFRYKIARAMASCHWTTTGLSDEGKIHTCRPNYEYWKNIIDQVNAGKAILSLRQWEGAPFRSKRPEFLHLTKAGIEKLDIIVDPIAHSLPQAAAVKVYINGRAIDTNTFEKLALNDGLSGKVDLIDWLGWKDFTNGCIIHFTAFRYQPGLEKRRSRGSCV